MGQTLENLSKKSLPDKAIFHNRFVVEVCETIHVHYRNLRLSLAVMDWQALAAGLADSVKRWARRGEPYPDPKHHIELCRKKVATEDDQKEVLVNLNHNLYKHHKGEVFADGAGCDDDLYIHLKIRDMRLEFTIEEFKVIADAIGEANTKIQNRSIGSVLQKT